MWPFRKRGPAIVTYQDPVDRRFRFFGTRRHLAGLPYDLPKDDQEISRLDFQHYMLRYAFKGNYLGSRFQPARYSRRGMRVGALANGNGAGVSRS